MTRQGILDALAVTVLWLATAVSVAADGELWIMTGALGGDTRYTQEFPTREGATGQLRFTRYNVSVDSFESKMEYTTDGRETWTPGNHQVFTRK